MIEVAAATAALGCEGYRRMALGGVVLSLLLGGGGWYYGIGLKGLPKLFLCGINGRNIHVLADVAWWTMFLDGQGNRIVFLGGIYGRNSYGLADLAWCTTLFTMEGATEMYVWVGFMGATIMENQYMVCAIPS